MIRKVKYKNFDRILTVKLLGDYSQNVPKPKRTQVKMYLRGDKIYSSEIKTYPSGVKTYPVCSQNVPMIHCLDGKDAISTLKRVEQINCGD